MKWTYGVTTVPQRRDDLLPQTLRSLAAGGFDQPRLFVDGGNQDNDWLRIEKEQTFRWPPVKAWGNWILALWELWLRDPAADRYALFQDDFVCVRNLRSYLDACWPIKNGVTDPLSNRRAYLNLYTFLNNEQVIAGTERGTWMEGSLIFHEQGGNKDRLQRGRGAVALVFSNLGVETLLSSVHVVRKSRAQMGTCFEGKNIDGAVVNAMNLAGWRELIHNPSLVRHTGFETTVREEVRFPHPSDQSFPGEQTDAMSFLAAKTATTEAS